MTILIFPKRPQKFMWLSDLLWTAIQPHKYQSVTRKEAEKCGWTWKERQDYFPMFSTCETIAGILCLVLGFLNTRKMLANCRESSRRPSRWFQRSLPPYISLWFCEQAAVEEVEEKGIQILWARIVSKAIVLRKYSPRFSRAGKC